MESIAKIKSTLLYKAKTSKDPDELIRLSDNDNWAVRAAVAENINTPIKTLIKLAHDKVWEVVAWVIDNPKLPKETII